MQTGGAKAVAKTGTPPRKKSTRKKQSKASGRRPARNAATKRARTGAPVDEPPRTVRVRELDPRAKIGARTSVERLFRVDETVKGAVVPHLVFFDRHGLYCEHGRSCPAVDDVRRAHRNLDWTR